MSLYPFLLLVFFGALDGQRTIRRECQCEYDVDGRCAFTLLVPHSEGCADHIFSTRTGWSQLRSELDGLRDAISPASLADNDTTDSTIRELRARLDVLERRVAGFGSDACSSRALLGLADDDHFARNASSSLPGYDADRSRLDGTRAWCPLTRLNVDGTTGEPKKIGQDWLQFTLDRARPVYSIVTRGRQDYEQYVMRYKVSYSNDNVGWTFVKDLLGRDLEFEGNNDKDSLKVNDLWQPIVARHVRIYPLKSFEDGNFCMRADIVSCLDN